MFVPKTNEISQFGDNFPKCGSAGSKCSISGLPGFLDGKRPTLSQLQLQKANPFVEKGQKYSI